MEPRGYRNGDEREYLKKSINEKSNKSTSYKKVINLDFDELNDPIRKNKQRLTDDDCSNILIDLYLFGKGKDINS